MQWFKSPGGTPHFLSVHAATYNTFYHQRHLLKSPNFKESRAASFKVSSSATAST